MSLSHLKEVPNAKTIMLVGPPGAGKTTFCHQTVLHNLAAHRPIILVTTECSTTEAEKSLKEKGLTGSQAGLLKFIDGFNKTVGLPALDRPDTISISCGNLTNLGIAIVKHQRNINKKGILLVLDSLTSPYLLAGSDVVRFFRLTLSRFAAEGNSVLACFDEGSGKEEDSVGMMSVSNGVIKVNVERDCRIFDIVKHPGLKPGRIEIPLTPSPIKKGSGIDLDYLRRNVHLFFGISGPSLRKEVGDYVNIVWRNLILWSGMLWDSKRFPKMMYDWIKFHYNLRNSKRAKRASFIPLRKKLDLKLHMPKSVSSVNDMKRAIAFSSKKMETVYKVFRMQYLEDISRTDEHYVRLYENYECWGFENVGAPLALVRPAMSAAMLNQLEGKNDWNVVHTKCIGLGHPYCEDKRVRGATDEIAASLEKDQPVVEEINDRLMNYILDFLLHGRPLMERPTLGNTIHIHELQRITNAPIPLEEFRYIFRMGGAKTGKILGERLMNSGLKETEAVNQIIRLIDYCKVGRVTFGETLRIAENCEKLGFKTREPSCYFTTGFLNGFFYALKNCHVKETKCVAVGDPYCEWEFV